MPSLSAPALRSAVAIDMINDNWNESDGIRPDLDPEYEAIQGWFWVNNLYQLIEQSFKLLIQHISQDQSPPKIHRLCDLYRRLDEAYRTMIGGAYRGYRELHDYLQDDDIESFLERADRGRGNQAGATTWKYFLFEGFPSNENEKPTIHIGAMLEISIICGRIIKSVVGLNEICEPIRPVILRIHGSLIEAFSSIEHDRCDLSEDQTGSQNQSGCLKDHHFKRIKYCRDLLDRNMFWVTRYMKSMPRPELSKGDTAILTEICDKVKAAHKHDFVHYITQLENGGLKLFDVRRRDLADGSYMIVDVPCP